MKFVRTAIYAAIVLGVISGWEYCRDDVLSVIGKEIVSNEKTEPNEQKEQSSPKAGETIAETDETPVASRDRSPEITFQKGFEDVAKKAMHSVVNVATQQLIEGGPELDVPDMFKGSPFDDVLKDFFGFSRKKSKARKANALGSGFIIQVDKDKAYVVTNNHVVEKANKIFVCLCDEAELPAEVHATDPRMDIAVLSVSLKGLDLDKLKLVPMSWGDSSKIHEGNFVIAIGNPFGFGNTVTHGIVSAKGRNIAMGKTSLSLTEDFIQHSAPINMGNSGGALLDVSGKVIGINSAIFSTSGTNIGIGFAIPSNLAKITVDQLIKHKRTFRGWLGAEVHAVNSQQAESVGLIKKGVLDTLKIFGAYVSKVVPNGPAEKAGLKVGDIIIEFNDKKIAENCSLPMAVSSAEIGSSVSMKVWRNKGSKWQEEDLTVKVGDFEKAMKTGDIDAKDDVNSLSKDKSNQAEIDSLGITIANIPEQDRLNYTEGVNVVVTKVDPGKTNSFYGPLFQSGDVFISADGKKVKSVSQFKDIMNGIKKDPNKRNGLIPFEIIRDGSQMMLATNVTFSEKGN